MTSLASHLVFAAGVLLLLLSAFKINVLRIVKNGTAKVAATTSREGVTKSLSPGYLAALETPKLFLLLAFAWISMAFSNELSNSSLGLAICLFLACYLGLQVWLLTTQGHNPRPLFVIDTMLYLLPASCFAVAVAIRVVI